MKRWHEELPRTCREWRKHWLSHVESNINYCRVPGKDPYDVDCPCDTQKGRFRKQKAFDCGNPQCDMCHSNKYPKRYQTYQEWAADLKLKEQTDEFDEYGRPGR